QFKAQIVITLCALLAGGSNVVHLFILQVTTYFRTGQSKKKADPEGSAFIRLCYSADRHD
ncbi:hypothetical protein, partial [Marinobacter sp.]|uniref:hypothetical protein n=1 Tax=Marinobacter sp. TaxID=50741 RepID=UPI0035C6FD59